MSTLLFGKAPLDSGSMADRYWMPKRPGVDPGLDPALSGGFWVDGSPSADFNPFAPDAAGENLKSEASDKLLNAQTLAGVRVVIDQYRRGGFSPFSDESERAAWAVVLQESRRAPSHELHEFRRGRMSSRLSSRGNQRELWEIVTNTRWVTRDGQLYGTEEAGAPFIGGRPPGVRATEPGELTPDFSGQAYAVVPTGARVRVERRGSRQLLAAGVQVWWEKGFGWSTIREFIAMIS